MPLDQSFIRRFHNPRRKRRAHRPRRRPRPQFVINMYIYNKIGLPCTEATGSRLSLIWHKTPDETYCHHAYIDIPFVSSSLFIPDIVAVAVVTKIHNYLINSNYVYKEETKRYLNSLSATTGALRIHLNSPELIKALCLNAWTLKKGKRNLPKAYPIKLSVMVENQIYKWDFDVLSGTTPMLICEKDFLNMVVGQKIETTINLDSVSN